MNQEVITMILNDLVKVLICAVFTFSITLLKSKLGEVKFKKQFDIAYRVVTAIEQNRQNTSASGAHKKDLANTLLTKILGKKASSDQVNLLIESAVFEMNKLVEKQAQELNTGVINLEQVATPIVGVGKPLKEVSSPVIPASTEKTQSETAKNIFSDEEIEKMATSLVTSIISKTQNQKK